ncbi:tescalcin a isoform X3 [Carcharodon carcharias]|uniref:tescalcin a isoform X3 n=1 Tax=Carcharodon carcharias TaxID=13397 RepID=UPI001B7DC2D6|nr:tescalcin a isoform X3 [Carcharodon carcharias]
MGSSPSLPAWEIRNLANTTGFTSEQIEILHRRFLHLTDGKDTMCKDCFDNIPDLECNPIKSRIVNAFFDKRNLGLQSIGTVDEITFENFLTTLSFFQHMGNSHSKEDLEYYKTEKLRFLFRMYDTNGDGKITLDELREEPDQVYDGITFNDFLKIMQDIKIETKMHVRFLNMDTTAICK